MKILKLFAVALIMALLLCPTVSAEHLPERNLIGTTIVVEHDRNVVEDNLKDKLEFDPSDYTATVMTKSRFFRICTAPALIVAASGGILLAATTIKLPKRKKSEEKE